MMMMMIKQEKHIDIKNPRWSPVLTMQICACSSLEFAEVELIERENMMMVLFLMVLMMVMVEQTQLAMMPVVVLMESCTIDYVMRSTMSMEKEQTAMMMMIYDRSDETIRSRCYCCCCCCYYLSSMMVVVSVVLK